MSWVCWVGLLGPALFGTVQSLLTLSGCDLVLDRISVMASGSTVFAGGGGTHESDFP